MTNKDIRLRIVEMMPNASLSAWKAAYKFVMEEDEVPTTIADINDKMIRETLERFDGNKRAAAQELGISERTIYRKTKQYGIQS